MAVDFNPSYSGTLNLGTGGVAGTLNASFVNGGGRADLVNFNQTRNFTFAPQLTDSLAVHEHGGGTTTPTAANRYTGVTTISEGMLRINSNQASATGTTIVSGAVASGTPTLAGNGTVGGNVVVSSAGGGTGGTLAPSSAAIGTLTVNDIATFQSCSIFEMEPGANAGSGARWRVDSVGPLVELMALSHTPGWQCLWNAA